jgi:hypothetical protein
MSDGQLAMNTNLVSPGLFLKDSNGDLVKVGPVHVGTTAPNATPGAGGQAGNSKGEQWLDTSSSRYVFKIWDGTDWRTEDGEFVNVSGDTMTGALGIIAGTNTAPGVFFSGDTNTGLFSPGADQLAISTNAVERVEFGTSEVVFNDGGANYDFRIEGDTDANLLFVDASTDRVGIGTSSPARILDVTSAPDTTDPSNGATFAIADPGLTPTQINSTTAGLGAGGIGNNHAGDFHLRSFWGVAIDKGAGNLTGPADNTVNADTRTFAIRQYAGGTTWNTQFCVNGSGNVGIGNTTPRTTLVVGSEGGYPAGSASDSCRLVVQSADLISKNGLRVVANNYDLASEAYLDLVNFGSKNYTYESGFRLTGGVAAGGSTSNAYLAFSTTTLPTDATESSTVTLSEKMRIDSSGRLLVGTSSDSGGALLQVNDNRIRIATANTPASAGATGTTGEIAWDANYIYVCTATNTWKRTAIATW